jgi:hypothetical protein
MTMFVPDGYCGLYCGACPRYLATKAGNAIELGMQPCQGCRSDGVGEGWCEICSYKACAKEKGLEFCYECAEYPCKDLEGFKTDSACPYHCEIYGYMDTIKEVGKEAWLAQMKERWGCPSCGREATWWDLACAGCGTELRGYEKPVVEA